MIRLPSPLLALCLASLTAGSILNARAQTSSVAFYDPAKNNGSWLDDAGNGLGEPLNVVISGLSDPRVLTAYYFPYYYHSLGFSGNCLGAIPESTQQADLGDGRGYVNQTAVIRWNYGDVNFGSCKETINGGNHFRQALIRHSKDSDSTEFLVNSYWQQSGSEANSNAIFMAVSYEAPLSRGHQIVNNGYDAGRDQLVANATVSQGTSFRNVSFYTTAERLSGYLPVGSEGVNHDIDLDGDIYLLTVNITQLSGPAAIAGSLKVHHWSMSTLSAVLLTVATATLLAF